MMIDPITMLTPATIIGGADSVRLIDLPKIEEKAFAIINIERTIKPSSSIDRLIG
jgi:hypothetical protein